MASLWPTGNTIYSIVGDCNRHHRSLLLDMMYVRYNNSYSRKRVIVNTKRKYFNVWSFCFFLSSLFSFKIAFMFFLLSFAPSHMFITFVFYFSLLHSHICVFYSLSSLSSLSLSLSLSSPCLYRLTFRFELIWWSLIREDFRILTLFSPELLSLSSITSKLLFIIILLFTLLQKQIGAQYHTLYDPKIMINCLLCRPNIILFFEILKHML